VAGLRSNSHDVRTRSSDAANALISRCSRFDRFSSSVKPREGREQGTNAQSAAARRKLHRDLPGRWRTMEWELQVDIGARLKSAPRHFCFQRLCANYFLVNGAQQTPVATKRKRHTAAWMLLPPHARRSEQRARHAVETLLRKVEKKRTISNAPNFHMATSYRFQFPIHNDCITRRFCCPGDLPPSGTGVETQPSSAIT
jgi:hypothetical protein